MGGYGESRSLVGLFLLLLNLLPLLQGIQLSDYELVVGNGARLFFFGNTHSPSINLEVAEATPKTRIISILPHIPTNMLYFTTTIKENNTALILAFNAETNLTSTLHRGRKGTIETLALGPNNTLIWANPAEKSVWSLSLSTLSNPTLLFQDMNASFDSIAYHPETGLILYTVWRRSNESQILAYNPTTKTSFSIVSDVYQPRALYVDLASSSLYWIDNPPGIYFNLGRIGLSPHNKEERELLLKDQNQHPYSLTFACSNLFWTDLMNKALWEWNPRSGIYNQLVSFNGTAPHGLALLNPVCPPAPTTATPSISILPDDVLPLIQQSHKDNISTCTPDERRLCLNGASCLKLHDHLHCLCALGYKGPNCGEEDVLSTKCTSWSSSAPNSPALVGTIIGMSCLVLLLVFVLAILLIKIRRLRKKPTIRRRVVVSHRSDLEINNSNNPATVCEMIDIENCCNMNVCETPCYERLGSFSGGSSSTLGGRIRKTSVKEDKKCLLTPSS